MQAARLFNWAPHSAFRPNEDLITIEVGASREKYHAHRNILIANSAFFASALGNKGFSETETGRVCLPEVNERAFPLWLEWAYSGKLPSAALDAALERHEGDLLPRSLKARQRLISAASFRLLQANAPSDMFQQVCDEFVDQNKDFFQCKKSLPASNTITSSEEKWWKGRNIIIDKLAECKQRSPRVALARIGKEINEVFDGMISDDPTRAEEYCHLKASFRNTCEAKLVAAQDDPVLKKVYVSTGQWDAGSLHHNLRPAFIHLIRTFVLADFLLSEQCKNMIMDAIAELSASSRYVPNAVDVGELWGYDNDVGNIEDLKSPTRQRGLKDLIREIYRSKNTMKLLMEEIDSYPELFLRELQALSHEPLKKTCAWALQERRCNTYHTHVTTARCLPPCEPTKTLPMILQE